MKNNILHLTENNLTLIEYEPKAVGSIIEFEIGLPKGALIDSLALKGTVISSEAVHYDNGGKYIQNIRFLDQSAPDRLILKAYIKYLERNKVIDELVANKKIEGLYENSDIKSIMVNFYECSEEIFERFALIEFSYTKTKNRFLH
ncbi:MAG: hypothetical protein HOK67_07045 [Deltaproteobacteria bacterium]|nr:hypothetical protein [Deltaproteobacteria bacterium]